ncbi:hypothetical protein BN134_4224 [Cronobacter dublinensis 1210]|uniref:Uncharacterized protein n=1 Tax=Cronobacter dublinensis 1210 TaxID=1208656 RepID=A0ABM9QCW1_9ENTR|nr:hypothetical protein BN134_4224 [Cronobacter dublinensis 1210]
MSEPGISLPASFAFICRQKLFYATAYTVDFGVTLNASELAR